MIAAAVGSVRAPGDHGSDETSRSGLNADAELITFQDQQCLLQITNSVRE
jgi:hypothetical protein